MADQVETDRLLKMQVLERLDSFSGKTEATLTVKSVYDWRVKVREQIVNGQLVEEKKWMRRSRLVAREFSN